MKSMFRHAAVTGMALLTLAVAPLAAKALMVAPNPLPFRVASAEVVVVGTVASLEEKTTFSKKDGVEYQVATLKIEKGIKGVKDITHIRVAWPAPQKPVQPGINPVDPNLPVRPILPGRGRIVGMNLQKDQEVLLLLKKHEMEAFYVGADFMPVVHKTGNPNFKAELAEVERGIKVMADPLASLKSKDNEERLLAVALQMQKYRTNRTGNPAKQPIEKEESKLILKTIAESDWNENAAPNRGPGSYMTNPRNLFYQLQLTPADGWTQPRPDPKNPANFQKDFETAAKKWLTDNMDKYVIQRFVDGKLEEK